MIERAMIGVLLFILVACVMGLGLHLAGYWPMPPACPAPYHAVSVREPDTLMVINGVLTAWPQSRLECHL